MMKVEYRVIRTKGMLPVYYTTDPAEAAAAYERAGGGHILERITNLSYSKFERQVLTLAQIRELRLLF